VLLFLAVGVISNRETCLTPKKLVVLKYVILNSRGEAPSVYAGHRFLELHWGRFLEPKFSVGAVTVDYSGTGERPR
jgi:hypothetical protein